MTANKKFDAPLYVFSNIFLFSFLAFIFCLHRWGDRSWMEVSSARLGWVLVAALLLSISSLSGIFRRGKFLVGQGKIAVIGATVILQAVLVIFVLGALEVLIRSATNRREVGEMFFGTMLLPRDFGKELERLQNSQDDFVKGKFYVYDSDLGWSIMPNAREKTGMYFSDEHGMRATTTSGKAAVSNKPIIALLGDSFTFGVGVPYAGSLGGWIEKNNPEFQVHNWGVSGYGLDQAVLRYSKAARRHSPAYVVLGVFPDDFTRSMTVYPFVRAPMWEYFSKPRFIKKEKLTVVNIPCLKAKDVAPPFEIVALPLINEDLGYMPHEWKGGFWKASYLLRYMVSRYPPATRDVKDNLQMVRSLNEEIIKQFIATTKADGTVPVLMYLPDRDDLSHPERSKREWLSSADFRFIDMTSELLKVKETERYASDGHYSALSNQLIAERLVREIKGGNSNF